MEMKIHVSRKVYLGRYETKSFGMEVSFDVDDYEKEFPKKVKEMDQLLEAVAEEFKEKNKQLLRLENQREVKDRAKAISK